MCSMWAWTWSSSQALKISEACHNCIECIGHKEIINYIVVISLILSLTLSYSLTSDIQELHIVASEPLTLLCISVYELSTHWRITEGALKIQMHRLYPRLIRVFQGGAPERCLMYSQG